MTNAASNFLGAFVVFLQVAWGFLPICEGIANYLRTAAEHKHNVYYLTQLLWVRNLGQASLGDSGSDALMKLQSRCCLGLHHLKAWLGLEYPFPRWLTHMPSSSMLVTGSRLQFLSMRTCLEGFLCVFTTWPLPPQRERSRTARRKAIYLHDLASEVTYRYFCHILLVTKWSLFDGGD